jgi:enamine deaminase RidA (YjgF/YER057c/UK114 family)
MSSTKAAILSPNAPAPSPLMSQGIIINGTIYCSGSLGIDPKTGKFVDGDASDRTVEPPYLYTTHHHVGIFPANIDIKVRALRNLEEVLKSGGSDLSKVVKVTIFLSSMQHYTKVNEGYGKVFNDGVKPV